MISREIVFNESEILSKIHQLDPVEIEGRLDSQGQYLKVEFSGKSTLDYHDEVA